MILTTPGATGWATLTPPNVKTGATPDTQNPIIPTNNSNNGNNAKGTSAGAGLVDNLLLAGGFANMVNVFGNQSAGPIGSPGWANGGQGHDVVNQSDGFVLPELSIDPAKYFDWLKSSVEEANSEIKYGDSNVYNDLNVALFEQDGSIISNQGKNYDSISGMLGKAESTSMKELNKMHAELTEQIKEQIYMANNMIASLGAQKDLLNYQLSTDGGFNTKPPVGLDVMIRRLVDGYKTFQFNQPSASPIKGGAGGGVLAKVSKGPDADASYGWIPATKEIQTTQHQLDEDRKLLNWASNGDYQKNLQAKIDAEQSKVTQLTTYRNNLNVELCGPGHQYTGGGCDTTADSYGSAANPGLIPRQIDINRQIGILKSDLSLVNDNYIRLWGGRQLNEFAGDLAQTWDPSTDNMAKDAKVRAKKSVAQVQSLMLAQMQENAKEQAAEQAKANSQSRRSPAARADSSLAPLTPVIRNLLEMGNGIGTILSAAKVVAFAQAPLIMADDAKFQSLAKTRLSVAEYTKKVEKVNGDLQKLNTKQLASYAEHGADPKQVSGSLWRYTQDTFKARDQVDKLKNQLAPRLGDYNKMLAGLKLPAPGAKPTADQERALYQGIASFQCNFVESCISGQVDRISSPFTSVNIYGEDPHGRDFQGSIQNTAIDQDAYIPWQNLVSAYKATGLEWAFGGGDNPIASTEEDFAVENLAQNHQEALKDPNYYPPPFDNALWAPLTDENHNLIPIIGPDGESTGKVQMGWVPLSGAYQQSFFYQEKSTLDPLFAQLGEDNKLQIQETDAANKAYSQYKSDNADLAKYIPDWPVPSSPTPSSTGGADATNVASVLDPQSNRDISVPTGMIGTGTSITIPGWIIPESIGMAKDVYRWIGDKTDDLLSQRDLSYFAGAGGLLAGTGVVLGAVMTSEIWVPAVIGGAVIAGVSSFLKGASSYATGGDPLGATISGLNTGSTWFLMGAAPLFSASALTGAVPDSLQGVKWVDTVGGWLEGGSNYAQRAWNLVNSTPLITPYGTATVGSVVDVLGTAGSYILGPGVMIGEIAAPLVPYDLTAYIGKSVTDGSFTMKGLLGALTAPVDQVIGGVAWGMGAVQGIIPNDSIAAAGAYNRALGVGAVAGNAVAAAFGIDPVSLIHHEVPGKPDNGLDEAAYQASLTKFLPGADIAKNKDGSYSLSLQSNAPQTFLPQLGTPQQGTGLSLAMTAARNEAIANGNPLAIATALTMNAIKITGDVSLFGLGGQYVNGMAQGLLGKGVISDIIGTVAPALPMYDFYHSQITNLANARQTGDYSVFTYEFASMALGVAGVHAGDVSGSAFAQTVISESVKLGVIAALGQVIPADMAVYGGMFVPIAAGNLSGAYQLNAADRASVSQWLTNAGDVAVPVDALARMARSGISSDYNMVDQIIKGDTISLDGGAKVKTLGDLQLAANTALFQANSDDVTPTQLISLRQPGGTVELVNGIILSGDRISSVALADVQAARIVSETGGLKTAEQAIGDPNFSEITLSNGIRVTVDGHLRDALSRAYVNTDAAERAVIDAHLSSHNASMAEAVMSSRSPIVDNALLEKARGVESRALSADRAIVGSQFKTVDGATYKVTGVEGDQYQVQRLVKGTPTDPKAEWANPEAMDTSSVKKTVEMNALQERAAEMQTAGLSQLANNLNYMAAERALEIRQADVADQTSKGDTSKVGQIELARAQAAADVAGQALVQAQARIDPTVTLAAVIDAGAQASASRAVLQDLVADAKDQIAKLETAAEVPDAAPEGTTRSSLADLKSTVADLTADGIDATKSPETLRAQAAESSARSDLAREQARALRANDDDARLASADAGVKDAAAKLYKAQSKVVLTEEIGKTQSEIDQITATIKRLSSDVSDQDKADLAAKKSFAQDRLNLLVEGQKALDLKGSEYEKAVQNIKVRETALARAEAEFKVDKGHGGFKEQIDVAKARANDNTLSQEARDEAKLKAAALKAERDLQVLKQLNADPGSKAYRDAYTTAESRWKDLNDWTKGHSSAVAANASPSEARGDKPPTVEKAPEATSQQKASGIIEKYKMFDSVINEDAKRLSVVSLLEGYSIKLGTGGGKTKIGDFYVAAKNAQVYLIVPERQHVEKLFDTDSSGLSDKKIIEKLTDGRKTLHNLDELFENYDKGETGRKAMLDALRDPNAAFAVSRTAANFIELRAVSDEVLREAWNGALPGGAKRVALMDEVQTLAAHETVIEAKGSDKTLASTPEGMAIYNRVGKIYESLTSDVTRATSYAEFLLAMKTDTAATPQLVRYYDPVNDRSYITDSAVAKVMEKSGAEKYQVLSSANGLGQFESPFEKGAVVEKNRVTPIDDTGKRQPDRTISDPYYSAVFAVAARARMLASGADASALPSAESVPVSETLMQVTEAQAHARYSEVVGMTATPEGVETLLRNKIGTEVVDIDVTAPAVERNVNWLGAPPSASVVANNIIKALNGEDRFAGMNLQRALVSGMTSDQLNEIQSILRANGITAVERVGAAALESRGKALTEWGKGQPKVILLEGRSGTVGTDWQGNFYQTGDSTWYSKSAFDQLVGRVQRINGNEKISGVEKGERFQAYREFWTDPAQLNNIILRISKPQADALIEQWGRNTGTVADAALLRRARAGEKLDANETKSLNALMDQMKRNPATADVAKMLQRSKAGEDLTAEDIVKVNNLIDQWSQNKGTVEVAGLLQRAQAGEVLTVGEMEALKQHYLQAVAQTNALLSEVTEADQRVMLLQPIQKVSGLNLSEGERTMLQQAVQKISSGGDNRFASNLPEDTYTNAGDHVVQLFNQTKAQAVEILTSLMKSIDNVEAKGILSEALAQMDAVKDSASTDQSGKRLTSQDVDTPQKALDYSKQVAKDMIPIQSGTDPVTARAMKMVDEAVAQVFTEAGKASPVGSGTPLDMGKISLLDRASDSPVSVKIDSYGIRQAAIEAIRSNPTAAQSTPILGILAVAPISHVPSIISQYAFNQALSFVATYGNAKNHAQVVQAVQQLAPHVAISPAQAMRFAATYGGRTNYSQLAQAVQQLAPGVTISPSQARNFSITYGGLTDFSQMTRVVQRLAPKVVIAPNQVALLERLPQSERVDLNKLNTPVNGTIIGLVGTVRMANPGLVSSAVKFVGSAVQSFGDNYKSRGMKYALGSVALTLRTIKPSAPANVRALTNSIVADPSLSPLAAVYLNQYAASHSSLADTLDDATIQKLADSAATKLSSTGGTDEERRQAVGQRRNDVTNILTTARTIALNAPQAKVETGDGYTVEWVKQNGVMTATMRIAQLTASAGLRIVSLSSLPGLAGAAVRIQAAAGVDEAQEAGVRRLAMQTNSANEARGVTARVTVDRSAKTQGMLSGILMNLRHPFAAMQARSQARSGEVKSGPVFELEKAVTGIERLDQLESMAPFLEKMGDKAPKGADMKKAVEAQRQAVDDALSRLRAVAGQMGKALELGLIHSGRLNANVQTLIRALADPAKSNGDARAAIENYLKAATEAAHALMLGPAEGLSGRIHAVTLKPEDTPLAMMHAKLVSAVKGNPQANAILGRYINPASAAQAGRWVRRGKAGAQEAYENLPTELERYHRDLVDVIAVEEARLARAQRNPRAGSSIKSKRQVVMTQRGTALSGLLPLVGQAFSQVPAEYDGVIDQLIQKESAQGLPLVIVTPDSLGYRELSNLRSRFENGNVKLITLSTYQDFMKEKGQVTDQARSEAMQDLMPKLEEAQAAPSAPVADSLAETAAKASVKLMAPVIVLPTPEQKQRSLLARAAAVAGLGVIVVAYQSLVFHGVAPDFMTLFQPAQADPTQVASAGFASPVAFAGFLLLRYWGKVRAAGQDISLNARNLGRILTNA